MAESKISKQLQGDWELLFICNHTGINTSTIGKFSDYKLIAIGTAQWSGDMNPLRFASNINILPTDLFKRTTSDLDMILSTNNSLNYVSDNQVNITAINNTSVPIVIYGIK